MLQVNTFYEVKISINVNNCHINTNIFNMSVMPMWKIDLNMDEEFLCNL